MSNTYLVAINLDAICASEDGKKNYGAWLRGEISGNELAIKLNASTRDTQNGIYGLLTSAKLQTITDDGKKCGAIVQVADDESLATAANRIASQGF